jgi:ectoine hydroxylase-related dioxygenase (phytanoyl-CoA dioxygenase family)
MGGVLTRGSTATEPRPTLRDEAAEREFRRRGFVVLDWLDDEAVATLRSLALELHPVAPADSPWECDFYTEDEAAKARVQEVVGAAFEPAITRTFVDHATYLHAFVVNWPGDGGGLPLHQHSSVVDEPTFRSAVVWCALSDTGSVNGTLSVVPGSHHVNRGPKAERSADWFEARTDELLSSWAERVELRPGQALVFDNALLHVSDENRGTEPRLTAVATVAPRFADLHYYSTADDDQVEVYRLDPEFFLQQVAGDFEWAEPEGLELVDTRPAVHWQPTDDELHRILGPAADPPRRPRRRRWSRHRGLDRQR